VGGFPLSPSADAVGTAVATVAALPASAPEAQLRWVTGRGRFYQRLAGDWVSRPEMSDPAFASASLSISAAGDDDAPGTSQDPIRTLGEWNARTARLPIAQATLTLLDALTDETEALIGGACDGDLNRWVYITAAPAVLLTTTINAVTAWALDASTNTVGTITGTESLAAYAGTSGLGGIGGYPGALWRIVGGPRDGACGVLGRAEGGGDAVIFVPPVSALYAVDTVIPQVGDTIEIVEPLTLAQKLKIGGNCNVFLDGVSLGNGGDHDVQIATGSKLWASGCAITGGLDVLQAGGAELTGCACFGALRAEGDGAGGSSRLDVRACHTRGITVRSAGLSLVSDVVTSYEAVIEGGGSMTIASGFLFSDAPGTAALFLGTGARLDAAGVFNGRGSVGGTSGRVIAGPGSLFTYAAKPNVEGTGSELGANKTTATFASLPIAGGTSGAYIVAR